LPTPASQGAPCLVPVEVESDGSTCRGFITRLGASSAAVSTDPALEIGTSVTLSFRRPLDNTEVKVSGRVEELLAEGGLWRGRPAALINLVDALPGDFLGNGEPRTATPLRRGSEARAAGLGGALRSTGLGRRRHTAAHPLQLKKTEPEPAAEVRQEPTPEPVRDLSDGWIAHLADGDDDTTAPPRADLGLTDPEHHLAIEPVAFFTGEEEVPPVRTTGSELAPVLPTESGSPPRLDESDDDFFGMFGRVADLPEYALPPGAEDSGALGGVPDLVQQARERKAPEPDRLPVANDGYFDLGGAPPEQPAPEPTPEPPSFDSEAPPPLPNELLEPVDPDSTGERRRFEELLDSGLHAPLRSDEPPVRNTMSIGGARPPWEEDGDDDDDDDAARSLIPRNARIASSLPVVFWARGRSNSATAQNFSKEGLFLAYPGSPPVRGAIVRVEFPLEGDAESVPVRFNAEVRWHTADRPNVSLPEGFGVQILTFESPKDRLRYDQILLAILSLHADQERKEQGFTWGTRR